jgi:hypothetical protein
MKGGGQSMSRRSNLVVPEYNPNEGVRPEEVLYFSIQWKIKDSRLNIVDYRTMEYDNNGSFTNRYIKVDHGTPQRHTWKLDNIDGIVHDVINTNVNYYRNLFRLMNRLISRGIGWIETKILDEIKGDHIVRNTILQRKYEMLAIQNFLIDSSVTDYEITPQFDDEEHLRQIGDEIPTINNSQRELIRANPLREPVAIAQPYAEGILQDEGHLTNPAHIYPPVNAPRMTTRVFPIPESMANDPYGRPTYGGKRKKKKTKKQRGAGGCFSRSVQPEQNYVYSHHNNTQVVPMDFVRPDMFVIYRCIWKYGSRRPSNYDMTQDYYGNNVDSWIDVIVNPDDDYREDGDWLFSPSPNIINEIDEEIKYYRRLDRQSHSGKVKDPYNDDKLLDKNQIKSKIYELYAIKYHVVYSQIEEARAEIVRPAEQAHAVRVHPTEQTSIINGGKRKIMKGGGGSLSRIQRNSTIYNSEGHPIVSPDDIIYIKTSWKSGIEPKYKSATISRDYVKGDFADSYVNVKLSNYWNYNWKFTSTNGDINPDIMRTLDYYFNLLRLSFARDIALDEINNIPISTWQIKLKIYQLHAIRKYFNINNATAEIIGGKRKKKTKRRKSKHNKSKKK